MVKRTLRLGPGLAERSPRPPWVGWGKRVVGSWRKHEKRLFQQQIVPSGHPTGRAGRQPSRGAAARSCLYGIPPPHANYLHRSN